jgi:hypothetical protein
MHTVNNANAKAGAMRDRLTLREKYFNSPTNVKLLFTEEDVRDCAS